MFIFLRDVDGVKKQAYGYLKIPICLYFYDEASRGITISSELLKFQYVYISTDCSRCD